MVASDEISEFVRRIWREVWVSGRVSNLEFEGLELVLISPNFLTQTMGLAILRKTLLRSCFF